MSERFELRVDPFWRPLIVPFGGTDARSYVEITDNRELRIRFGFLFDHAFPLASIEHAAGTRPSWWEGFGWHTNFAGSVGLLGSHDGCVELTLREIVTVNMPFPVRCQKLTMSLKLPRELIAALSAGGVATEQAL